MNKNNKYHLIISQIEKVRSKNNINWMNILRLAFKLDPVASKKIMKKINYDDKKISKLLTKLGKYFEQFLSTPAEQDCSPCSLGEPWRNGQRRRTFESTKMRNTCRGLRSLYSLEQRKIKRNHKKKV